MDFGLWELTRHIQHRIPFVSTSITVEFALEAHELARLSGGSQLYDDPYLIIQLSDGSQGYAFAHPKEVNISLASEAIGARVCDLELRQFTGYIRTALLDAVAPLCLPMPVPDQTIRLRGTAASKSSHRAKELVRLMSTQSGSRVGIVGGIEDIIRSVADLGCSIRVADFHLSGSSIGGVVAEDNYTAVLEWCDVALVTGNTVKTDTLDQVTRILRRRQIPAVAYCMTGHNLLPALLSELPFEWMVADSFPFYWFAGVESIMRVYSRRTPV